VGNKLGGFWVWGFLVGGVSTKSEQNGIENSKKTKGDGKIYISSVFQGEKPQGKEQPI